MSWLEKLLPPKIQPTDPSERRTVPEGLWVKCPACETVLYKTDLEQNLNVCPKCEHHHRIDSLAEQVGVEQALTRGGLAGDGVEQQVVPLLPQQFLGAVHDRAEEPAGHVGHDHADRVSLPAGQAGGVR